MDKTPTIPAGPVAVDYENLNAAALDGRIKEAARATAPAPEAAPIPPSAPTAAAPSSVAVPAPPAAPAPPAPPAPGAKARLKGKAVRLLSPLFPLMRLLALPLHEDLARVSQGLDAANRRMDGLERGSEYIKLLHLLCHNLTVEITKLRLEHEALKSRVKLMEKDLDFLTKRERAVEERVFPE